MLFARLSPALLLSALLLGACEDADVDTGAAPPVGDETGLDTADDDTASDDTADNDTADSGEAPVDADGDGYFDSGAAGEVDCDDGDDTIHPGAEEVCTADGAEPVDEDCDGEIDVGAVDALLWFADGDGDGYGDPAQTIAACEQPSDHIPAGATDCDDDDAAVHPGAEEIAGDWTDNDCDGVDLSEMSLAEADAKLLGEDHSDYAGASVAVVGDVDGDGYADLVVGAYWEDAGGTSAGAAYLVTSQVDGAPLSGDFELADARAKLVGERTGDYAGWSVSGAGDVDGDGYADVIVGAPYSDGGGSSSGAAYLISGATTGQLDLSAAQAVLTGATSNTGAGYAVSSAGDVNGDGWDDVLVGAPYLAVDRSDPGVVYLALGPVSSGSLGDADAKLTGERDSAAGSAVSSAGDLNGDGAADVVIGAPYDAWAGSYAGAAYVALGPISGDVDLSAADAKRSGESPLDLAGSSVAGAGDVDGDGYDDWLVGACDEDFSGEDAGAAYLLLGASAGGSVYGVDSLSAADAKLVGEAAGQNAGRSVSGAGDVDGDGRADLLVGAPGDTEGGYDYAGAAYLVMGAPAGVIPLQDAGNKFIGEDSWEYAGWALSGGDVDGDGLGDLLIGAYWEGEDSGYAGATYLVRSPWR